MASKPQSAPKQKKTPPVQREKLAADDQTERCILAFLILGGAWIDGLGDDLFSDRRHKLIWRAIESLHLRGASIERPAVAAELVEAKTLDAAGGLSYLIRLEDETGIHPTADIMPYVRRLLDAAKRRTMQRHAYALLGDLASGAKSTDELLANATEIYAKLGTRINAAGMSRLASVNLDAVQPTITLLNSLAVFGGRIQFESVKGRGPMIVATFLDKLRACQTHKRNPQGPPPESCVWHDGEYCYVHQPSLVEWLSTPGGRNRHYDWGDVRDALLLLDFTPEQIHRSYDGVSAKVRLWRGPLEILVDDETEA
jgi:hypothetical protein